MFSVSEKYINTLTEKTKTDRVEIVLTLTDGSVININDDKLIKGSLYVNNQCLNGSEFHFGCTYAGECGFSFKDNIDRYSLYDAKVEVTYFRLLEDNTEEVIPMGVFFVDEAERTYSVTNIKAIDNMTLLDVSVNEQTVGTVFELLTHLSTKCGFELAQTQAEIEALPNGTEMFSFYPDRIDTMRDALSYLSAVTATFAIFDRYGKLKLCSFSNVENWEITNDFRIKSKFNDAETFYKGLEVRFLANQNYYPYSHIEDERGEGLILDMGDIPIVQGTPEKKEIILTNIYNGLVALKYRPCEVDYFGNPAIDLGDLVSFSEGVSLITNFNWKYRGTHTLKSVGLNPKMQAVKDKTYKQLVNMEANIEGTKIGIYTSVNSQSYKIQNEPVKVITMQYSSVTDEKVLFFGAIQFDMDCDGEIEITYYVNQLLDEERTRKKYLSKGTHLLNLFDWLETEENSRNELWVFLQPFYVESDIRVQNAEIETQKNRISALIESVKNGTEFVEPTTTEIDKTVPTISILENEAKGIVFGQGLATTTYVWDGTLNLEDVLNNMIFDDTDILTLRSGIIDDLSLGVQIPVANVTTETIGTMSFDGPDDLRFGSGIIDILFFDDNECVFIDKNTDIFRTRNDKPFIVRNY